MTAAAPQHPGQNREQHARAEHAHRPARRRVPGNPAAVMLTLDFLAMSSRAGRDLAEQEALRIASKQPTAEQERLAVADAARAARDRQRAAQRAAYMRTYHRFWPSPTSLPASGR